MPGSGERTGHACFPGMLTGAFYQLLSSGTSSDLAGGISVDQYIGNKLQAGGYKGLVSLNQGTFVVSTGHLSWKAAGQVVLPNPDPASVFNLYFKGALPTTTPPTTTPADGGATAPPVDNTNAIRKSILDYVITDINRFSNIVGTDDKASIDSHLTSVREIEMRLQNMGTSGPATAVDGGGAISTATGNAACNVPSTAGEPTPTAVGNVPAITKLHMDLAVAAFAADLTRVAVMQISDQGAANLVMSWLGIRERRAAGLRSQHRRRQWISRDRAREHHAQGHMRHLVPVADRLHRGPAEEHHRRHRQVDARQQRGGRA